MPIESAMDATLGIFSAAMGFMSIVIGAISLMMFIAMWQMLKKMGEPGWYAIIPLFNMFVIAKHSFGNGWAMFVTMIPVVGAPWFFMQLFKGFGVDTVPALLLAIFAAPIGMLVFGFNKSSWVGM